MQSCILRILLENKRLEREKSKEKPEVMALTWAEERGRGWHGTMTSQTRLLARDFMEYAHHGSRHPQTSALQVEMIDLLSKNTNVECLRPDPFPQFRGFWSFLELAAVYGLRGYIYSICIQGSNEQARITTNCLLRYILPEEDCYVSHALPLPQVDMVSSLLLLGADPNDKGHNYNLESPWRNTLRFMARTQQEAKNCDERNAPKAPISRNLQLQYLQVMELLILSGTDPNAFVRILVHKPGNPSSAEEYKALYIVEHLLKKFPLEAAPVLRELKSAMRAPVVEKERMQQLDDLDNDEILKCVSALGTLMARRERGRVDRPLDDLDEDKILKYVSALEALEAGREGKRPRDDCDEDKLSGVCQRKRRTREGQ